MANTVYSNQVLEAKAKDLLTTTLDTKTLMTIDDSLASSAGMKKVINTYTYSGTAEELGEREGNTNIGSISYVPVEYEVKLVQQAFDYTDEDFMKDPSIVDNMLKGSNQVMANKMTSDFLAALASEKEGARLITNKVTAALSYDAIVDAIGELNLEDESKVFVVIPNAWKAKLRKDPDYVAARQGEVVYSGQVGTICGIPVVCSKALSSEAYVMTNEAVKLFIKKDIEVEQDRDKDKRINKVIERTCYLVALVDATKACIIAEA